MPSQPTVLIVPGAFHVPQHFDLLASLLRQAGYHVEVPALPSVGVEQDPGNALELDAGFLCDRLEELVCGSEAVAKFLEQHQQAASQPIPPNNPSTSPHTRRTGSIDHLIYLNSPLLSPNTTFHTTFPPSPTSDPTPSTSPQGLMTLPPSLAQSLFFTPSTPPHLANWATSLLRPQAASIGTTATTYGGFGWARFGLPVTYIGSRRDRMVREAVQEGMVRKLRESGVEVQTVWLERADHGAFLTCAEEIREVVGGVWG
ncbi:hypothetical protein NU219Hw_g7839t1 [Hortaea werneckii]